MDSRTIGDPSAMTDQRIDHRARRVVQSRQPPTENKSPKEERKTTTSSRRDWAHGSLRYTNSIASLKLTQRSLCFGSQMACNVDSHSLSDERGRRGDRMVGPEVVARGAAAAKGREDRLRLRLRDQHSMGSRPYYTQHVSWRHGRPRADVIRRSVPNGEAALVGVRKRRGGRGPRELSPAMGGTSRAARCGGILSNPRTRAGTRMCTLGGACARSATHTQGQSWFRAMLGFRHSILVLCRLD